MAKIDEVREDISIRSKLLMVFIGDSHQPQVGLLDCFI